MMTLIPGEDNGHLTFLTALRFIKLWAKSPLKNVCVLRYVDYNKFKSKFIGVIDGSVDFVIFIQNRSAFE
jgi:hypothetical protein